MAFRCGKVFVSYSSSVNPRLFHFTPHQNTQIFRSVSTSIPRCTLRTEKGRNSRGTFVVRSMSDGEILFNFPSFTFHQMNVVFFLFYWIKSPSFQMSDFNSSANLSTSLHSHPSPTSSTQSIYFLFCVSLCATSGCYDFRGKMYRDDWGLQSTQKRFPLGYPQRLFCYLKVFSMRIHCWYYQR